MLRRLSIRHYALIDQVDWECTRGWTVLTGETGSGKSILLGALGLVLGERADGPDESRREKCIVEAEFDLSPAARAMLGPLDEGGECIIRRSIAPGGRSRAYVNDEPVNLQFLKALAPFLVDLHGQQDGQRLHASEGLLHAIDGFADGGTALAEEWRSAFGRWREAKEALEQLEAMDGMPEADGDYLAFQLEELEAVDPGNPKWRNLDARLDALAHAVDIRQALEATSEGLGGSTDITGLLRRIEQQLERVQAVHGEAAELLGRIRSCRIELDDIGREADRAAESVDLDPAALAQAEADRDRINRLLDKHRVADLDGLTEKLAAMHGQLEEARQRDQRLTALRSEVKEGRQRLDEVGSRLDMARKSSGDALARAILEHLVHLKLPSARMAFEWSPAPGPESAGPSRVSMAFSANPGRPMQPLNKVASGGERSRVMLALKAALAEHLEVPTLILDEIDAGVSGDVAARMADLIATIARDTQVITISHLPQVAGKADHHLRVHKEERDGRAHTLLTPLDAEARIEELATMLSGRTVGEAARQQARSLMG